MEDLFEVLRAAFAEVDLELVHGWQADSNTATGDYVVDPSGLAIGLEVKHGSSVTAWMARMWMATRRISLDPDPDLVPMVVANRITAEARDELLAAGWGYLDRRGHLALRVGHRLIINTAVAPTWSSPERTEALAGKAGLEVATALLMYPDRSVAIRELARQLHRSPSTVSTIAASLRRERLVDDDLRPRGSRLFWAVAERWPSTRAYVAEVPTPALGVAAPLRLGLEDVENSTGWALTDSAAAAAMGAPIAVRSDSPVDFFVPDESILRRARQLLGSAPSRDSARCSLRVAPVPAVCSHRLDLRTLSSEWPVAHPLFVALDLTLDRGRGREILQEWVPVGGWSRVW